MKNEVCRSESLMPATEEFDTEFEKEIGITFRLYLLLSKLMPSFMRFSCIFGKIVAYDNMISHFDELVAQVNY